MARIKELTEEFCSELDQEIAAALQPLADKHQIDLTMLPGYLFPDGTTYGARCQFALPERVETVASQKEEEDYLCYAESFGMRAEWLGQSFTRGNFTYKVVGLRVHAPKECAILERSDGSRCYENGALIAHHLAE